jgi:hypothetical protein
MEKIPTAKEIIDIDYYHLHLDTDSICLGSIETAMIEFAKLHVEAALKEVSGKMFNTYHTVCEDGSTKGVFKTQEEALNLADKLNFNSRLYHDWVKITRLIGGYYEDSILNSYPLENIK